MGLLYFNPFLYTVLLCFADCVLGEACHQARSRVVRGILQHHLRSLKNDYGEVPRNCPFHMARDIFQDHEAHKTEEGYGKWCCDYCGKMFYAENFLDQHMQNKHAQFLYQAPDSVCLSDYCDIFRCDVVSARDNPTFWDTALCIEDDMSGMVAKCKSAFNHCLPRDNSSLVYMAMNKTRHIVCSSLTCNRYWYTGKVEESQWWMLLKTFCTVMLIGTLIVYYFLAYQHFYSESLFYEPRVPPLPMKPYIPGPNHTISNPAVHRKRRRTKVTSASYQLQSAS